MKVYFDTSGISQIYESEQWRHGIFDRFPPANHDYVFSFLLLIEVAKSARRHPERCQGIAKLISDIKNHRPIRSVYRILELEREVQVSEFNLFLDDLENTTFDKILEAMVRLNQSDIDNLWEMQVKIVHEGEMFHKWMYTSIKLKKEKIRKMRDEGVKFEHKGRPEIFAYKKMSTQLCQQVQYHFKYVKCDHQTIKNVFDLRHWAHHKYVECILALQLCNVAEPSALPGYKIKKGAKYRINDNSYADLQHTFLGGICDVFITRDAEQGIYFLSAWANQPNKKAMHFDADSVQ